MTLSRTTVWSITLVYALVVGSLASQHVLWRDEARPLNIVAASGSIPELFRNVHNEGHPALWYLVLYAGFQLTHSTLVLKASSLVIAITAIFVFLSRAPFALRHKLLFTFGVFPIFEYSVRCRDYGLCMLFLFLFGAAHRHRNEKPFVVALILGLLANSHALGLIIAGALWCSLVAELLMARSLPGAGKSRGRKIIAALGLEAATFIVSVPPILPDRTTLLTPLYRLDAASAARAVVHALLNPGEVYTKAFGVTSGIFLSLIVMAILVYLLRHVTLALILLLVTGGFAAFFALVYPVQPYHTGLFLMVIVLLLWLEAEAQPRRGPVRLARLIDGIGARRDAVVSLGLLMQVALAIPAVRADLTAGSSASRRFAHFLRDSEALRDAILVGEPGAFMESVHYYASNEIYFPRERRFGTWVQYTTASQQVLSLKELLETAMRLRRETGRPVVIAFAYRLSPEGPFEREGAFGSRFVYTPESLSAWRAKTMKLGEFRGATGDENFDAYRLDETP